MAAPSPAVALAALAIASASLAPCAAQSPVDDDTVPPHDWARGRVVPVHVVPKGSLTLAVRGQARFRAVFGNARIYDSHQPGGGS